MTESRLMALEAVELAYEIDNHLIPVLRGVDLEVAAQDFVLIHGEIGAGKSALVNIMAGLENPSRGRVRVGGIETTGLDQPAAQQVFQSFVGFFGPWFRLNARWTAADVFAVCRRTPRYDPDQIAEIFELDPGDPRPLGDVSADLRRRIDCARVLMSGPRLIIADLATPPWGEPPRMADLQRIHRELGVTVVATIDRDMDVAEARSIALSDGQIIERSLSA